MKRNTWNTIGGFEWSRFDEISYPTNPVRERASVNDSLLSWGMELNFDKVNMEKFSVLKISALKV